MSPYVTIPTLVFILLLQRNLIKRKLEVSTLVHSRYRKSKENCKRLQQAEAKSHLLLFEIGKKFFKIIPLKVQKLTRSLLYNCFSKNNIAERFDNKTTVTVLQKISKSEVDFFKIQ